MKQKSAASGNYNKLQINQDTYTKTENILIKQIKASVHCSHTNQFIVVLDVVDAIQYLKFL